MDKAEIQHLASLARIRITEEEAASLGSEFDNILAYVHEVQSISEDEVADTTLPSLRNIFREDEESHEPGQYTEDILSAAPQREGSYIHVKKILEQ